MTDWYKSWFDSPYYHVLYRDRDDSEARLFLDNITAWLEPPRGAEMLDQACGRGRHAVYLSELGYDVTGTDLSEGNIEHCRRFSHPKLRFFVHDMRDPVAEGKFDCIFNIFTSIGYFDTDADQERVVKSAATALKPGGMYVIDFMNVRKVEKEMVGHEQKQVEGICFDINRRMEKGFIRKSISFMHNDRQYDFEENVEAMTRTDFERYFRSAGLVTQAVFGGYRLEVFEEEVSDRLVMVALKKAGDKTE